MTALLEDLNWTCFKIAYGLWLKLNQDRWNHWQGRMSDFDSG